MASTPTLNDKAIRAALKSAEKTGTAARLNDGDGMRLDVQPSGSATWRMAEPQSGGHDKRR